MKEDQIKYPVQFNGKVRFQLEVDAGLNPKEVEEVLMSHDQTAQYLDGKEPRKVIVVPGRIVNVVV